jgi:formiminoglutamate deiminase
MYEVAARLDPPSYQALATAVYGEMLLAGITGVGEFHYLHHGPGGVRYDEPNAFGLALVAAARAAGIRITLLDTCYLVGGLEPDGSVRELDQVQRRFSDGDVASWIRRISALHRDYAGADGVLIGAAIHSVRGVRAEDLPAIASWAAEREVPLHVHLSEQLAENTGCLASYGLTPAALLARAGVLGPRTTAIHATHLTSEDIALLGGSGTGVCFCPTTERDLADGIGPAPALAGAGSPLSLGSDSHAVIDLFEEARAIELNERLASRERGHFTAEALLGAATVTGHRALGWTDAGSIAVGQRADLVAVRLDSVRTAGAGARSETAVFAATAADITEVVADGERLVVDGRHRDLDVGRRLAETIEEVLG